MSLIIPTDKVPTLRQLQLLKTKEGISVRIIEAVAHDWQSVAMALGFDGPRIKNLEKDYPSRCEDASREMFTKWLNKDHDLRRPLTWVTLIDCLEQAEMKSLAEKSNTMSQQTLL